MKYLFTNRRLVRISFVSGGDKRSGHAGQHTSDSSNPDVAPLLSAVVAGVLSVATNKIIWRF
jgi:hypothetical protein